MKIAASFLGISLLFGIINSHAGSIVTDSVSVEPQSFDSSCFYQFADSYYLANSPTPPSVNGTGGEVNLYGPELKLRFNNSPNSNTPPVPCNGYYQVSVSIVVRNNDGVGCSTGLNTIALAVTSTDPQQPNVYGCPVRYPNFCCTIGNSGCCQWYPYYVGYNGVQACAMTTQWAQCSWANNYNGQFWWDWGRNHPWMSTGYPMFTYTPYWGYNPYDRFGPMYTDQCTYPGYPPYTCQVMSGYQYVLQTPHKAYCTQKPIYFQKLVYLHKGATISAPSIWSKISQSIYTAYGPGNIAACGMSVTGGELKVFYMHP